MAIRAGVSSLPAWGAWIETLYQKVGKSSKKCRSPPGERGLKRLLYARAPSRRWSLPAWGAWIETRTRLAQRLPGQCRSPPGERGLKRTCCSGRESFFSRSPPGERGLKHIDRAERRPSDWSLPAWGAWIETARHEPVRGLYSRRSPPGERGLKRSQLTRVMAGVIGRSPPGERGLKPQN